MYLTNISLYIDDTKFGKLCAKAEDSTPFCILHVGKNRLTFDKVKFTVESLSL